MFRHNRMSVMLTTHSLIDIGKQISGFDAIWPPVICLTESRLCFLKLARYFIHEAKYSLSLVRQCWIVARSIWLCRKGEKLLYFINNV